MAYESEDATYCAEDISDVIVLKDLRILRIFDMQWDIDISRIKRRCNRYLPISISILTFEEIKSICFIIA